MFILENQIIVANMNTLAAKFMLSWSFQVLGSFCKDVGLKKSAGDDSDFI